MKRLPIGIQSFRDLRESNFLYIDKTAVIYELISSGKFTFLSRPRRFGKSLLLSTIKHLFLGNKDLFEGLWVEDKWNWEQKNPVLHISMASIGHKVIGLENALAAEIEKFSKIYQIELTEHGTTRLFKELIEKLSQKGDVVLLIDEYDKPIIDYLGDDFEQANANQKTLKEFYSVIKDCGKYLRFLLITGISKFSKVSIFSDLNNLDDLTFDPMAVDLLGYTQAEVVHYFEDYIEDISRKKQLSKTALLAKIKLWYNGYSWDGETFVYNPFSVLSFFKKRGQFKNHWFNTGTPTFLINLAKQHFYYNYDGIQVNALAVESYDIANLELLPLLFQTGYLTIKEVEEDDIYTLAYPNKEVKDSMLQYLITAFCHTDSAGTAVHVLQLRTAFRNHDLEKVISIINGLFRAIPNHIFIAEKEAYFHSIVFLMFLYLGQYIEAEVNTANGRIDAIVQTDERIYIIEFKLDKKVDQALAQIREKGYGDRYQNENKKLLALAICFSSNLKKVEDWKVEEL